MGFWTKREKFLDVRLETPAAVICSLLDKAKRSKPISKSLSGSSEPIIFDHMTQFGKICTPMGALVIRLRWVYGILKGEYGLRWRVWIWETEQQMLGECGPCRLSRPFLSQRQNLYLSLREQRLFLHWHSLVLKTRTQYHHGTASPMNCSYKRPSAVATTDWTDEPGLSTWTSIQAGLGVVSGRLGGTVLVSFDSSTIGVSVGNSDGEGSLEPVDGMAMSNLEVLSRKMGQRLRLVFFKRTGITCRTPVSLLDHLSEFRVKLSNSVLEISIHLFKLGSNVVKCFICVLNLSCNRLNPMIKVLQNNILCCCILSLPIEDDFKRARFFQLSSKGRNHRWTRGYTCLRFARKSDENHQGNTIKTSSDPLHIHGRPITRARAKKMQAALNGLIEKIWIENAIQDARHHELGLKRRQGIVGIIQVIGQPNTQFVSNAKRSNSE
ncbi:hypothetical protein WN944_026875 [Citrus x changshan-huyou]|uniref:Uncharacterized protein n=1 Tax=Citrus x changshan-huyou TaxID=2935761 RepID=A0AAP0LGW2_9ROSI